MRDYDPTELKMLIVGFYNEYTKLFSPGLNEEYEIFCRFKKTFDTYLRKEGYDFYVAVSLPKPQVFAPIKTRQEFEQAIWRL